MPVRLCGACTCGRVHSVSRVPVRAATCRLCVRTAFGAWLHTPSLRVSVLCQGHLNIWLDNADDSGREPAALLLLDEVTGRWVCPESRRLDGRAPVAAGLA